MQEVFVIGDIHGMYDAFEKMLTQWNPQTQQLILLGDLIDRGPQSLKVLNKVRQLQQDFGAICLRGNHEEMLLETLEDAEQFFPRYKRNGGLTTLAELLHKPLDVLEQVSGDVLAQDVLQRHAWLYDWLQSLPYYIEFGNFVCVHAGVDLSLSDWQQSTARDFVWIREAFHQLPNTTGRTFIFGHTPTKRLNADESDMIWQSDYKIGIDGGAVYGGSLHAVRLSVDTLLDIYTIDTKKEIL